MQRTLIFLDGIIVVYFLIEMFLKVCCSILLLHGVHFHINQVVAFGLILHRGSYLRSFFNVVDCFVVISSLIPILYYVSASNTSSGTIVLPDG